MAKRKGLERIYARINTAQEKLSVAIDGIYAEMPELKDSEMREAYELISDDLEREFS